MLPLTCARAVVEPHDAATNVNTRHRQMFANLNKTNLLTVTDRIVVRREGTAL
jgi:hypothetical protein